MAWQLDAMMAVGMAVRSVAVLALCHVNLGVWLPLAITRSMLMRSALLYMSEPSQHHDQGDIKLTLTTRAAALLNP